MRLEPSRTRPTTQNCPNTALSRLWEIRERRHCRACLINLFLPNIQKLFGTL